MAQEPFLAPQTAAETGQRAVRTDTAVAGNDDRDPVGIIGLSHRPKCRRLADRTGQIAVGTGFPERHIEKLFPDTPFELRAVVMKRHAKLETFAGQIGLKFFGKLFERIAATRNDMRIQFALQSRHGVDARLLVMELNGEKMRFAGDGKDRADRRFEPFCIKADLFHRSFSRLFVLAFM